MIVYSNSCSFGEVQPHTVYSDVVANGLSAKLINKGKAGSCNRRIIRSSLRDLIDLKTQDRVVLLLGLTFVSRTEIWRPDLSAIDNDGHFHSISVNHKKFDWSIHGLIDTVIPDIHKTADPVISDYYQQWLIHYCPESEVTNLLTDIIMFVGWCKNNNIDYIVFSNVDCLPDHNKIGYTSPFIQNLRQEIEQDSNILDPWSFSFGTHSLNSGFVPKDQHLYGRHGHPGEEAHIQFGNLLLEHFKKNYSL